jgi:plasmid stabilization system protein ParE
MPKKIIWSKEAVSDYSSNIDYLIENWPLKEVQEFIEKSSQVINIISKMPEVFPVSEYKKVRKALICKQINLLYQVHKSDIVLLRFWDNRQKPVNPK